MELCIGGAKVEAFQFYGSATAKPRWDRAEQTEVLAEYDARDPALSQRAFCERGGVARSTLRNWEERRAALPGPAAHVLFLESPEGLTFLHRFEVAMHLTLHEEGAVGERVLGRLLKLSGLDSYIASSKGALQDKAAAMDAAIVDFGALQEARVQAHVCERREIGLVFDEMFRRGMDLLIALEPHSGFVVLEVAAERRDHVTWSTALAPRLEVFPLTVRLGCGDLASGIKKCVEDDLELPYIPEVFHVQHELSLATGAPLARLQKEAEGALEKIRARNGKVVAPTPATPAELVAGGEAASEALCAEALAAEELSVATERRAQMGECRRGLGTAFHPFDLTTGVERSAEQVGADLEAHVQRARELSEAAGLSAARTAHLDKAARALPAMAIGIAFFWEMVTAKLALLSAREADLVRTLMLPGLYLLRAAGKVREQAPRAALRERAHALLGRLESDARWQHMSLLQRMALAHMAERLLDLFLRSSSALEGRNGYLSLRFFAWRTLSPLRLSALTVLHNYWLKRADGTTACQRLFDVVPEDLFDYLLTHVDWPARPTTPGQGHKLLN